MNKFSYLRIFERRQMSTNDKNVNKFLYSIKKDYGKNMLYLLTILVVKVQ